MDTDMKKSVEIKKISKTARTISECSRASDIKYCAMPAKTSIKSPPSSLGFEDTSIDAISKESFIFETPKGVKVIDIYGVRIRPAMVSFDNTFENQSYMETVSVQNISENSLTVRIQNPRAWSFRVTPLERGYLLAPGLKITRRLHYTCTKNGIVHSSLPIFINDSVVELPLEACKGQAFVEIIPTSINFGRVDIGCKPVERRVVIKNVSFCATKFLIDVGRNELDLHISPLKGWIRPHSSVTITIQLLALQEGEHSSEIWITTDLCQTRIHLQMEACKRNLIVLHPNTISDFTLVDFPVTFYGCRRYQTVVIYNMAAASSAFVVLADFGGLGLKPFREAKKGGHKQIKMFDVEPIEGRIRPFEGRIFTFWFNPVVAEESEQRGWKSENAEDVNDYLCAVRIKRIQVDDFVAISAISGEEGDNSSVKALPLSIPGNSASTSSLDVLVKEEEEEASVPVLEEISVLVYLYGEAEIASLSVRPDILHFPHTPVGTSVVKVIQITNDSRHMIAFRYSKIPFFDVTPDFEKLAPKTTYDVVVKFCARNIGVLKRNLIFEILAQANATDKKDFNVINRVTVKITGEVKSQTAIPEPKFNPGITPKITHEVGFLTDEVTFSSKVEKPRCAMVTVNKQGRPWMETDATIAFPNDMPLTLRPRATDATAKTIFKGLKRYVAPLDESLTYTVEALLRKKAHDDWFLSYIRGTAAVSASKDSCCKWKHSKPEPDPPIVFYEKKEANWPREVFVPLTFVQLYRIKVYPALISFGSVTTSKSCNQLLNIENKNDFKITAKIMPITSGIIIQTLDHFIVDENSEAKIMLTFQRETLGRYSGTITCVINGYHSIDIAVVAEVVHRSLTISPEHVDIKIPEVPFASTYVPVAINNPLNIPVTFSWVVPDESPIKVEPVVGVAPKRGMVWCVAYFECENPNYRLHPIKLMVEGTVCHKMKTGVVLPKTNVYFLVPVLNVGFIPINLPTIKRFNIFNPDFSDAMFVVLNKEPIKGVKVKPSSGTIKARSCYTLTLEFIVTSERSLDFTIFMNLQNSVTIEMKVIGTIVYPQVEINPKYVNLIRVPCNSITRTTLTAENKSKAKAEVWFEMDDFPQFKVSLSKRHHDPGLSSKGFTLEPGSSQKFYLHFIPKDLASYDFYLPVVINNLFSYRTSSPKEMEAQQKIIKCMYRTYTSCDTKRTCSTGINQKALTAHLVLIDVVVLKPILVLSDLEIFFSSTSETESFTATNTSDQLINIVLRSEDSQPLFQFKVDKGLVKRAQLINWIDQIGDTQLTHLKKEFQMSTEHLLHYKHTFLYISSLFGDFFKLRVVEEKKVAVEALRDRSSFKLVIMPGESVKYIATFNATVPGTYISDVSILTVIDEHPCIYNTVRLTGTIYLPCVITPSVNEIYFQPVPLGVEVSFIFHLKVTHHRQNKETIINYEINNPSADLFSVEFPRGNVVAGVNKGSVPVKIQFRSFFPISLRKQITFTGGKNIECTVNMIATADNSIVTTHAFLTTHSPYQPRLKEFAEVLERTTSETNERIVPLPQHLKRETSMTKGSSSGSSQNSSLSLNTISSPSCPIKRSIHPTTNMKRSTADLGRRNASSSDTELSLHLSEKEEKPPSLRPSIMLSQVVTKEGDESSFPMFPMGQEASEISIHMNKTLDAVQQWVYEQVFCCSYFHFFGSHSFSSFSIANKKDYSHSSPVALKNIFDALERICGRRIRRFFTPIDKLPEDKTAKAVFTYNVYRQLVDFMVVQGALMSHVEPKYLMVYEEYCCYQKTIPTTNRSQDTNTESELTEDHSSELMTEEKFMSVSVQCWLDLFLQMFKTLVLAPTVGVTLKIADSTHDAGKKVTHFSPDYDVKKSLYSRSEEVLMTWLTHQYNAQRTVVWPDKSPPPRTIANFDVDLEDGLVLTAVTAAYCPYLIQLHFQDMFLNPTTISQAYHNTTCLTTAWESIKLGFSVTPRDFVRPNTIKMLLLVTHLFKILPSYKPEATISFKAILNSCETQIVNLQNDEEFTITYHVEILPNTANFFLEDCNNSFVLKRKSKGQITVEYIARNTNKAEAILLLCGACMPPKFGRNYVFKLEGYPVKLPVSSSFNVVSPQNIPVTTQITIDSPHILNLKADETLSYDIWIAYTEPQPGNLNALCWAKERRRKIPRRLYILSNTLTVSISKKKMGIGEMAFKVCCFSQVVCDFWLIFRNQEIGDFIVKLQISPRRPEPSMKLQLVMKSEASCSCATDRSSICSRYVLVDVPCRNLDQWAAVRTMFELTISPAEKEFWAVYIETNIGFRLLQWMLEEKKEKLNEELELLFKKSKTYKVSCPSQYITCMPTLQVPDVRAKSTIPVQLHCDVNTPNHSTILTLTSLDGHEIRCYNLEVINNKKTSKPSKLK